MNKKERLNRIIARGELSNHSHIIVGEAIVTKEDEKTIVEIPEGHTAQIKHLLESNWIAGSEAWTGEHTDINLDLTGDVRHGDVYLKKVSERKYEYIQQVEYDPFEDIIRDVID